jgi:hypothetical protein
MDDITYILMTFWHMLETNPGRLVPFLASACAITLVIAVVTDALFQRPPARRQSADKQQKSILR